MKLEKLIIAAGGTGGHVFPALAVAQNFIEYNPEGKVLFVGAQGGREVEWVKKAGFSIQTVWISGWQRGKIFRNITLPLKLIVSFYQAWQIIRSFQPQVIIGFGGYPSYPTLQVALWLKKIPTLIHESNAYPGLVNRLLASKVNKVLLGNSQAQKYFPQGIYTGNPVRKELGKVSTRAALEKWKFSITSPVILVLGGSLGARTINLAMQKAYMNILRANIQILWQCGKIYYPQLQTQIHLPAQGMVLVPFIDDMAAAYSCASLVITRAGAITLAELIATQKPSILIPSPNVAENHQYYNALSLSEKGCALLLKDEDAIDKLEKTILEVFARPHLLAQMQKNMASFEKNNAVENILNQILEVIS
ncbi:MAG: undecaprenyldiphospho-muramoylpentapeptide beta-N-acetylglucosaminyltransferase [Bacteroidia bacterium]|nr:undecaprenyldiphospho-muramoylpentapeptide beta-N-acetylglucosaminyltransferase [Bacteroidia bacterium]MDW8158458.1 undecaprenyldiphospho-muramoylpentapeptide beta-N-acetylglucosaminyltransferase [Bacteroidia bacterium]